jgi:hypothetical protein
MYKTSKNVVFLSEFLQKKYSLTSKFEIWIK